MLDIEVCWGTFYYLWYAIYDQMIETDCILLLITVAQQALQACNASSAEMSPRCALYSPSPYVFKHRQYCNLVPGDMLTLVKVLK